MLFVDSRSSVPHVSRRDRGRFLTGRRWMIASIGGAILLAAISGVAHSQTDQETDLAQPEEVMTEEGSDFNRLSGRLDRLEQENQVLREALITREGGYTQPSATENHSVFQAFHDRLSKLEVRAAEKLPLIKLGGFMQLDNAFVGQDQASRNTYGDIQDGTGFRRTRLQAYGALAEHTNYIIEMDFAVAGRPSFMDVWGEQTNLGWLGTVRIGHFRQPTTMDGWTSIRHLEFLERSNAFQAFDPFRRVGIMAYNATEDRRVTWAYSIYRSGFTFLNPANNSENYGELGDTRYGTFYGDNGGWSGALRATALPWLEECEGEINLLHVGGGFNYSRIGGNGLAPGAINGNTYIARSIPGVFVGDPQLQGNSLTGIPFLTNTGNIPASEFNFWHAELAGQYGPAHFQTEFMLTDLTTYTAGNQILTGLYAQCGYFLTGEQCGYNKPLGVLDYNTKPHHERWGAWEVAYRFDFTNLPNVGQTPPTDVANNVTNPVGPATPNPGQLYQNTLALNWWWNANTRVQFNYINSFNDSDFAIYGKSHTHIFATRFQVEF